MISQAVHILDLTGKIFKAVIINMFKELKATMLKDLKKSMMTLAYQIETISAEVEVIKRAKWKLWT